HNRLSPLPLLTHPCPPTPPPFPYTTLFRSAITQNDADRKPIDIRPNNVFGVDPSQGLPRCDFVGDRTSADEFMATGVTWWARSRSEEHTSELQSLTNLVCRLLLQKKQAPPQ